VPKGVDTSFWVPEHRPRSVFRVGFVGQLQLIKGLQYLFDAWGKLGYGPAVELWVAGPKVTYVVNGQRSWQCGRLFDPWLTKAGVVYKGWYRSRTNLRNFYNSLDVLVAPSIEDGWNMAAVEAMACAKPVITTTTTGMSQIVEDGINGFVIHPAASDEIAEKIEWCRMHPDAVTAMGLAARETVLDYDIPAYKRRLVEAFYSCVGVRSVFNIRSPVEWTQQQVDMFSGEFFLSARKRVDENQRIIRALLDCVKPGSKVLDVGCLDGSVSTLLLEHGCDVVACDLPEIAKKARELHPGLTVVDVDLNSAFPEGQYDVVFASGVLEHLYNDFFFLCNCCQSLSQDGVFIISSVGFDDWCPLHLRIYPERQFRTLLTMAGFVRVDFSLSDGQRLVAIARKGTDDTTS